MINFKDIQDSYNLIKPYIHKTPLMLSESISEEVGTNVYLKLESLQRTGAFKLRGALAKILRNQKEADNKEIYTASSGNHGLGVAYASSIVGLKSTIVVPAYTPKKKIKALERLEAKVIAEGENWNESFQIASNLSKKNNGLLIHPFQDEEVIAGQGSIAIEILDQIESPPSHFLASIGGGSMIASCAVVFKEMSPNTKVYGVQTKQANAMYESIQQNRIIELNSVSTLVESFATKTVSNITLDLVKQNVDEIFLLDENECKKAAMFALERTNILIELSAAINIAALQNKIFPFSKDDNIVITICGGNYNLHEISDDLKDFLDHNY